MEALSNDILNKQKPPINVFLNSPRSLKKKGKWKSTTQGAADTLTLRSPFSHLITWSWDFFFFNCLENCLPGALSFLERNSLLIHNCNYSKAAWLPRIQPSSNSSIKAIYPGALSERPRHPQWRRPGAEDESVRSDWPAGDKPACSRPGAEQRASTAWRAIMSVRNIPISWLHCTNSKRV